MASNKQYISDAKQLAKELGISVSIEGLNNNKLAALVSDLKARKRDAINVQRFFVVEGKAITSKRGILSDGDEITSDDLTGGEEALNDFVQSGYVA